MNPPIRPVKLMAAVLFQAPADLETCLKVLGNQFSALDFQSPAYAFHFTDYYREEMGGDLQRVLVSFQKLVSPDALVEMKWAVHTMETQLSRRGKRRVNIDPGYLDLFKLVLASFKPRGNKIYLGRGVWADMTLFFEAGRFHSFPWSFPDFKSGLYQEAMGHIRERYKRQLRETGVCPDRAES